MSERNASSVLLPLLMPFSIIGINPYDQNLIKIKLINFLILFQFIIIIYGLGCDLYFNSQSVEAFEGMYWICTNILVLCKFIWMIQKKKILVELFNGIETSTIKKFASRMSEKIFKIRIYSIFKATIIIFCIIVWLFTLYKYCNKKLLFPGYYGASEESYYSYLFSYQILVAILVGFVYLTFEVLFAFFVAIIFFQADLVKDSIKNLKMYKEMKNLEEELQIIVIEHNRILNYTKTVKKAYFDILLISFLLGQASMAFLLNVITNKSCFMTWEIQPLFGLIFMIEAFQIAVYCLGGMIIDEQLKSIANEVYNVKWYQYNSKLSKALQLVMIRAQNSDSLTAGNLIKVDLNTFTFIFTNSFKICAVFQSIQN